MAVLYTTLAKEAHAEQTIERSRFIAHAAPVRDREEAEAFIRRTREEYKDASTNAPAFVVGDKMQIQWGSDDGEPSGTAGAPMVQMLVKEGITNAVIVVTRYFGGIKLGTGGLVRAFTGTAKLAVEAAGLHQVKDVCLLSFELPYSLLGKLQNNERSMPFTIEDIAYLEVLRLRISFEPEDEGLIRSMLSDLSGGKYTEKEELVCIKL